MSDESSALLHELHVHQIELEMQNDELRCARDQVEAGLQRYTELFDFAPVGYVVLDEEGTVRDANLEFARMVGLPRAALDGWLFATLIDAAQSTAVGEFVRRRLRGEPGQPSASLDVALRRNKGEPLTVRLVASAHAGATPSVLVAVHDVSASKRAELAREEVAHRDAFMTALSHELRNPLFPICSGLTVLERAEPGSPQARSAIATIGRQVHHLVHIVDDLLDVTRISRGKVNLRRERLELGGLVRQVVEDYRLQFQDHGLTLEGRAEPEPLWVDADRTRVVQVIGNLLMNASKFTPAGGRVTVGLRREESHAVIWVGDTGLGIPADVQEHLFEPFIQAPQTLDRSRGGLGLGLAMVKGLVELHGGTVGVESSGPGRGSEFSVRLPLVEPPAAALGPVVPGPGTGSHRILVIEDNVDVADTMRELFTFDGHDARVAYDGAAGLDVARGFHPEFVFCDIGLPGMDGYEVARAFRSDPAFADTYLVALSGYARPEDRQRSAEAGFDCHLAKPPSTEDVARVLAGTFPGGARRG